MTDRKSVENQRRLRTLKVARLKYKEAQLNLYINEGYDNKTITQTMRDIQKLRLELNK